MIKKMALAAVVAVCAQAQAQRIDINNSSNRTEDDFTGWVIGTESTASITVDGVTVKLSVETDGSTASTSRTLKGEWWKDGVNKYSKLVCDGVGVYGHDADNNTPQIQQGEVGMVLTVSGLAAGTHSLMAYHNNPSGYSGPALNVYVDGELKAEGLEQTNRAMTPSESCRSYVTFTAEEGQDVVFVYRTVPDPEVDYTQGYLTTSLFINSLEFDVNPFTCQLRAARRLRRRAHRAQLESRGRRSVPPRVLSRQRGSLGECRTALHGRGGDVYH